ncbi:MAG: hypothetical protein NZ518_08905, partial [Dehalococcoidia bacterium]|nr:hypothetical protein [Dehalococcoidia bacterium]
IATVYLYGNAAKYLPGAIWNYVARAYLGAQQGIGQQRVWTASLIDVTTAVATGLLVYGVSGFFPRQHSAFLPVWAPFVLALGVLAVISPPALRLVDRVVRRLRQRQSAPVEPPWHVTARYLLCAFVTWSVIGIAFWALVNGVYPLPLGAAPEAMGVWSLAVISGLVSVVAPQGLGVREGALALGLSGLLPPPVVIVVVVAARVWMIVCDLLAVVVWWTATVAENRVARRRRARARTVATAFQAKGRENL